MVDSLIKIWSIYSLSIWSIYSLMMKLDLKTKCILCWISYESIYLQSIYTCYLYTFKIINIINLSTMLEKKCIKNIIVKIDRPKEKNIKY